MISSTNMGSYSPINNHPTINNSRSPLHHHNGHANYNPVLASNNSKVQVNNMVGVI